MDTKYSISLTGPQLIKTSLFLINLLITNSLETTNLLVNNPNTPPHPPVSIFGDAITNHRHAQINILFAYSIPADKVATAVVDTGLINGSATIPTTANAVNSMAMLETGTGSTGSAVINSKVAIQYLPGHDVEFLFTGAFTTGVANSTQWIGAFTAADGFAVGYNGTAFSILYRNSASGSLVTTTIAQTSFNIDPLDGTGQSNITIDPTKLNIFKISFGWLGTAPIIFWIMRSDGQWFKFHTIQRPNSFAIPSVSLPMLQIRAEVTNAGNTSNLTFYTGSWTGGTIGNDDATIVRSYAQDRLNITNVTTERPLLTLRNITTNTTPSGILNTAYYGKTNYLNIKILFACASSQTGNTLTVFRLIKNVPAANLTGASFSNYNTGSSIAQVDTSATAYTGGGTQILSIFGSNDSSSNLPILSNQMQIVLLPGDTLTITGYATAAATVNASIAWQEPVAWSNF